MNATIMVLPRRRRYPSDTTEPSGSSSHRCRRPAPHHRVAIMDSQSVKAAETVSRDTRGFDGAKLNNGRKRHVVVDTTGLLVAVKVAPADVTGRRRRPRPAARTTFVLAAPVGMAERALRTAVAVRAQPR